MEVHSARPAGPQRFWAGTMWLLTALFTLRVLGQALQRWLPQAWLPPFAEWQGSSLDYSTLLAAQYVIIAAMAFASYGAWKGTMRSTRTRLQAAAWIGGIYMVGSIARPMIGFAFRQSPPWFHAEISSAFHVVLAGFVLALARYHALGLARLAGGTR